MKLLPFILSALFIAQASSTFAQDGDDDAGDPTTTSPSDRAQTYSQARQARIRQRQAIRREADATMAKQIREVSSWLENYCSSNVAFPNFGDEMTWVKGQLLQLIPYNPYDPDQIARATSSVDIAVPLEGSSPAGQILSTEPEEAQFIASTTDRFDIKVDQGMTLEQARQALTDPPDDWEAQPGTICIISTNQGRNQNSPTDFFIVWGAGADGKPVRDPYTNRVVLVEGRWTQVIGK